MTLTATHRNLGDTLLKLGQTRQARAEYGQAIVLAQDVLKVNPADVDALSLQALCHAKLGRRAEAERLAERILGGPPLTATARYRTGVALVLVNNPAGVEHVVAAINAGYSRAVAARDDDLSAVRDADPLAAVLAEGAGK